MHYFTNIRINPVLFGHLKYLNRTVMLYFLRFLLPSSSVDRNDNFFFFSLDIDHERYGQRIILNGLNAVYYTMHQGAVADLKAYCSRLLGIKRKNPCRSAFLDALCI